MTAKVFALDTVSGIQRDGTVFDKNYYTDGVWCRFQRGRPRKMGGYRQIINNLAGPSRGIYVNPQQAFNNVFSGYNNGLQKLPINDVGIGSGITNFTLSNFTPNDNNMWQFDSFTDTTGTGNTLLLAHPGQNLSLIDNNTNTPVLGGPINGSTASAIGVFTASCNTTNGSKYLTLSQANTLIGAGQSVTGTGIAPNTTVVSANSVAELLDSVTVTSTSGAFSCTSTSGLFVDQTVTVSGSPSTGTITNPAITGTSGTFSCSNTIGLYVDQPVTISGTLATTALANVQVTSTAGDISFTTQEGVYVGMPVSVTGTLSGSATGITTNTTYYVIGTPTNTTAQLSAAPGGAAIATTAGTTTGLTFKGPLQTGVTSGTTYFITATNGSTTFTLSATKGGAAITTVVNSLSGLTFSVPLSIGLNSGQTYYIVATNGSTTFTLSATQGGAAVTTVINTTTGYVFTLGTYFKVELNNNATASGSVTLTFDNQISVSGGVVVLHPYVFVYGNNGFIKNCSAGNINDWVSADANEVNVATGKIVQGLPVRGGSNAPSGLFWSLDSLVRVSYIGGTGTPPQYWRYDIISTQSSIMSSQSVIEYDGIYYWCGVDRFLLYNGVVKEIPNNMNQNYFFDNLNYEQRQKVWVSKVPRFGEIWWYYPRGNSTECNDAIVYNVRENTWYDAGQAIGARRSAGYFSQVFHYPINADTNVNAVGALDYVSISNQGAGYTNGSYTGLAVTGGTGSGATIDATVAGGVVTTITVSLRGTNYTVGDTCSASIPGGANFAFTVDKTMSYVSLWQHEIGVDAVSGVSITAVESAFETNDLGWVSGGPAQPSPMGENNWIRVERVEPDFIMTGNMELYVTGRPYAQADDYTSDAYVFDDTTHKIDMREQRRELRLRFVSNVQGGNYQLGKLLLSADFGDVRGY